jgi:hypothetical protein
MLVPSFLYLFLALNPTDFYYVCTILFHAHSPSLGRSIIGNWLSIADRFNKNDNSFSALTLGILQELIIIFESLRFTVYVYKLHLFPAIVNKMKCTHFELNAQTNFKFRRVLSLLTMFSFFFAKSKCFGYFQLTLPQSQYHSFHPHTNPQQTHTYSTNS